ncbi:hypothetical protein D3C80_775280 [compost metagenome]
MKYKPHANRTVEPDETDVLRRCQIRRQTQANSLRALPDRDRPSLALEGSVCLDRTVLSEGGTRSSGVSVASDITGSSDAKLVRLQRSWRTILRNVADVTQVMGLQHKAPVSIQ